MLGLDKLFSKRKLEELVNYTVKSKVFLLGTLVFFFILEYDRAGDVMFYCILGIVIGGILFLHSLVTIISKKKKMGVYCFNIFCSFGFMGSGIGGFFMPKSLEYITMLLLLFFSICFLVSYYLFLKERKNSNQRKINSCK